MHAGRSTEEALSTEQLCQRRLDHVHQLRKLYEIELMNALEEQRSRHSHSQKSVPGERPFMVSLACMLSQGHPALSTCSAHITSRASHHQHLHLVMCQQR